MIEAKEYLFKLLEELRGKSIETADYQEAMELYKQSRSSLMTYRINHGVVPFDIKMANITARILVNEARNRHISNVLVERFGTDGALVMEAYERGDYDEELGVEDD